MRFDATVAGRTIRVEVHRENDHYAVTLDGTPLDVDLVESGDHFASLIVDGLSHEVGLERRPDGYRVHLPAATVAVVGVMFLRLQILKVGLYVSRALVERLSTGGRAAYYGLAPNEHHRPHPHFYCKRCGQMECLNPESLTLDSDAFGKTFPGRIDKVEVRLDGICKNCMR